MKTTLRAALAAALALHGAAFAALKLDYAYVPLPVAPERVGDAVFPIDARVTRADGSMETLSWDGRSAQRVFTIARLPAVQRVDVYPNGSPRLDAFATNGYEGYLTFEYFHPWQHWPEAFIFQTSDSLDRMLGRKSWAP